MAGEMPATAAADWTDWGEEVCAIRGHSMPVEIAPGHWECKDCGGEWFDSDDDDEE